MPDRTLSRDAIVERILDHPLGDRPDEHRPNFAELVWASEDTGPLWCDPVGWQAGELNPATIVHFHGGGYVFGSPATHRRLGEGLATVSGCRVLLPDIPLAPEHRWPAQLDFALALCAQTDGPLVLSGDSAGGHLALVTALALARRGTAPAGLVLFSPNTDRSGLSDTRERNDPLDPMVDDQGDRILAALVFGEQDKSDPQLSPVLDDLTLLPPTYLEVGQDEVLLGDSLILAERARTAGVALQLHVEPDSLHMGQLWAPWWPTANRSLARAGLFVSGLSLRADR